MEFSSLRERGYGIQQPRGRGYGIQQPRGRGYGIQQPGEGAMEFSSLRERGYGIQQPRGEELWNSAASGGRSYGIQQPRDEYDNKRAEIGFVLGKKCHNSDLPLNRPIFLPGIN